MVNGAASGFSVLAKNQAEFVRGGPGEIAGGDDASKNISWQPMPIPCDNGIRGCTRANQSRNGGEFRHFARDRTGRAGR